MRQAPTPGKPRRQSDCKAPSYQPGDEADQAKHDPQPPAMMTDVGDPPGEHEAPGNAEYCAEIEAGSETGEQRLKECERSDHQECDSGEIMPAGPVSDRSVGVPLPPVASRQGLQPWIAPSRLAASVRPMRRDYAPLQKASTRLGSRRSAMSALISLSARGSLDRATWRGEATNLLSAVVFMMACLRTRAGAAVRHPSLAGGEPVPPRGAQPYRPHWAAARSEQAKWAELRVWRAGACPSFGFWTSLARLAANAVRRSSPDVGAFSSREGVKAILTPRRRPAP